MNASRFDQIVKNRAQERVAKKIDCFRAQIAAALTELGQPFAPRYYHGFMPDQLQGDVSLVLNNIASGMYYQAGVPSRESPVKQTVWPRILWETERAEVEKQLLATMDEMQKALCAPAASSAGPQPETDDLTAGGAS